MKLRILIGMTLLVGSIATQALGQNSVNPNVVTPLFCQSVHRIDIRINNDVPLKSLTVPLIVYAYLPGGPATVQLSFDNRLSGTALSDIRESQLLFTEDGACKSGQAGGFGTVDFSDTSPHTIPGNTFGVLFHCATLGADYLPAAQESYGQGSLVMTFVSQDLGGGINFDTTCTDPANHLLFVDELDNAFVPAFSVDFTYADYWCTGHGDLDHDNFMTTLDIGIEIDYLFAGGSIEPNTRCFVNVDEADINCDGWPDSLDLSDLIDYIFAGGDPPCDPTFDCWYCDCTFKP